MENKKFGFERAMDLISKLFTILIPIVLFYWGNEFKKSQDADNKEQQNNNRITTLLKSLSSDNPLEKKLAIKFSEGLARANNFPIELLSVIYEVSNTDTANSKGALSVVDIVNQNAIADKNNVIEQKIREVAESSPTRVYMQIPKGYSMKEAQNLLNILKSDGYNMLGIERVDLDKSPKTSEVRYFKESDKINSINLAERIRKTGILIESKKIAGFETKITGSQLEVWLK